MKIMKILGIDPGYERVGFGLIECDANKRYHAKDWGIISTSKHESDASRLHGIHTAMISLLEQTQPDLAAIEKIFFCRNAKTMVPVAQARGVLLLSFQAHGIPYWEYTPMQVKMNMTGYGKSGKREIQEMVMQLLGMTELPKPDDAADALAIALSCAFEQGAVSLFSAR